MNGCISRERVLEIVCRDCVELDICDNRCAEYADIAKLPIAESQILWNAVEDRVPPVGEEVIVAIRDDSGDTSFEYATSGWYSGYGEKWVVDNEYNSHVTHWAPFPKYPRIMEGV